MPKAKPTQVYVHRIEAGEWERQNLLKPAADIAQTVKVLKTAAFVAMPVVAGGGLYLAWWVCDALYGWIDPAKQKMDDLKKRFRETAELRKADDGISLDDFVNPLNNPGYNEKGEATNIFGLPGWGIWPGVL